MSEAVVAIWVIAGAAAGVTTALVLAVDHDKGIAQSVSAGLAVFALFPLAILVIVAIGAHQWYRDWRPVRAKPTDQYLDDARREVDRLVP